MAATKSQLGPSIVINKSLRRRCWPRACGPRDGVPKPRAPKVARGGRCQRTTSGRSGSNLPLRAADRPEFKGAVKRIHAFAQCARALRARRHARGHGCSVLVFRRSGLRTRALLHHTGLPLQSERQYQPGAGRDAATVAPKDATLHGTSHRRHARQRPVAKAADERHCAPVC